MPRAPTAQGGFATEGLLWRRRLKHLQHKSGRFPSASPEPMRNPYGLMGLQHGKGAYDRSTTDSAHRAQASEAARDETQGLAQSKPSDLTARDAVGGSQVAAQADHTGATSAIHPVRAGHASGSHARPSQVEQDGSRIPSDVHGWIGWRHAGDKQCRRLPQSLTWSWVV